MKWRKLEIQQREDERGILKFLELGENTGLRITRIFWIESPREAITRGNHAHRTCTQIFICLKGQISVSLNSGDEKEVVVLTSDSPALVVEPLVWSTQEFTNPESLLLVGADEPYDSEEYISDWAEFSRLCSWIPKSRS